MELGLRAGAAVRRAVRSVRGRGGPAPAVPWLAGAVAEADFLDSGRFPELDCVERLLPPAALAAAKERAAAVGVGADRVLITTGRLSEEAYLRALGERTSASPSSRSTASRARAARSTTTR